MAIISKTHTFSSGTTIQSSQVNANFDDLYNTLSGSNTTVQLKVVSSDGSTPIILNQQSANYSQEWQNNGTTALRVQKSGVLESLVTTGTAPLTIASTTAVTNLNADMLDGVHSSGFAQISSGVLEISAEDPILRLTDTTSSKTDFDITTKDINGTPSVVFIEKDGSTEVFSVDNTGILNVLGQCRSVASAPVVSGDLTRKDYVDDRKVQFAIGGFFPGAASTSAARPSFIVPENVVSATVRKMTAVYQSGTASGITVIKWVHNGVDKNTVSISSLAVDTINKVEIPDVTLAADDIIYFAITGSGSHADITVQLIGDMKVTG